MFMRSELMYFSVYIASLSFTPNCDEVTPTATKWHAKAWYSVFSVVTFSGRVLKGGKQPSYNTATINNNENSYCTSTCLVPLFYDLYKLECLLKNNRNSTFACASWIGQELVCVLRVPPCSVKKKWPGICLAVKQWGQIIHKTLRL